MSDRRAVQPYSFHEELAHSLTHGLGVLLAVIGLAVLVATARARGDGWHLAACTVYGASLVLLYLVSTLYHGVRSPRAKRVLRVLDHSAIYLLIAGTYTPFTLVSLRGPWGWSLFALVWGLALAGVVFKTLATGRFGALSVALYLGMGWCALLAIKPLAASVDRGGMVLLVLGGLAYTLGVAFYAWRRLPYHHAVWHLFVLAGSIFHFFAVWLYVLPRPS